MSDFQKYLDEAFSKINTSDFSDSEEDLPRDDVYKEIQQLIVSERKKQKVTQKELAHRTGLSQANISNIENKEFKKENVEHYLTRIHQKFK